MKIDWTAIGNDAYQIGARAVYYCLCSFGIMFGGGVGWMATGRVMTRVLEAMR